MKTLKFFITFLLILFSLTFSTNAELIDRGGGLIYDTDLDITWLQDANFAQISGYDNDGMNWYESITWANNLVYQGYDDWRLPKTLVPDLGCTDPNTGKNCTGSEMGHLYYTELGNIGYPDNGWGLNNTGLFINLPSPDTYYNSSYFWSSTDYPSLNNYAYAFLFGWGSQTANSKTTDTIKYAWAVRNGDSFPIADFNISVSPNPYDFGNVLVGISSDQTITITNYGDTNLEIGNISQNDQLLAPFSILNDNCSGISIVPLKNCILTVRFSPTTDEIFNDSFDIPSNDPDTSIVTVSLNGTGTVPDITVTDSVSPIDDLKIPFGDVTVGNFSEQTVTVTNDGGSGLVIYTIAQANPLLDPFSIVTDQCSGNNIEPLSNCTITVRFSPHSTETYNDSFDISSSDPDENFVIVTVSGTGTQILVPDITVTDSVAPNDDLQIPFGNVTEGYYSEQTVTINNDGNADLVIGNIAQSNVLVPPFSIVTDNCSSQTLPASSSCTLTVRFSPDTTGAFSDSFDIQSNDPDENPVIVNIEGIGTPILVPDISVTDSIDPKDDLQIPFGNEAKGNSSDQTVTVTNEGNADLDIGNIALDNQLKDPFSILNDTCSGQTILPAVSCTLTVRFLPKNRGTYYDSFDIPTNDPDENPVIFNVSGSGLPSPNNNPPATPEMVYPTNGQIDLPTTVTYEWKPSTDLDGDPITYNLYYDTDPSFRGTALVQIASFNNTNTSYASIGYSSGLLLFAIVALSSINGRRKLFVLLLMGASVFFIYCGGGGNGGGNGGVPPPPPNTNITQTVSGLTSNTRYYWKVVAHDGLDISDSTIKSFMTGGQ